MTDDEYRALLDETGAPYFKAIEIFPRVPNRRKDRPYEGDEENMIPTLRLAVELRRRVGIPMDVVAACRKVGGAQNSKHISNSALDLDLLKAYRSDENIRRFHDICAEVFKLYGASLRMGMGHYTSAPYRVHIDTLNRPARVSWYYGPGSARHSPTIAMKGASAARK